MCDDNSCGNGKEKVPTVPFPQEVLPADNDNTNINSDDFPDGFIFGSATSAYQVEGAAAIGGKSMSVWDLTLRNPGRITDQSNGNVAVDMYHRFKEDIRTMKQMGFDAYRFSILWPRILPGGRWSAGVNREGIDYYNEVIDTIIEHGMEPHVTLFHWDLPHCPEKEYEGFLSKQIVNDFREYAKLWFWEFGDRVKSWSTINEPWTYAFNGYVTGVFPPNKASCTLEQALQSIPTYNYSLESRTIYQIALKYAKTKHEGEKLCSPRDAYIVGRNLLLAHAAAVESYRTKFKESQGGEIGIVLNSAWYIPYYINSEKDNSATRRAVDFMLGWFLDPVLYGRYPENMTKCVHPDNLAYFTPQESKKLEGSIDFLGFNYYTTHVAKHDPRPPGKGYHADRRIVKDLYETKDGLLIGEETGSSWLYMVPWGLHMHLKHLQETYKEKLPPIYITENGISEENNKERTAYEASVDPLRVKYYQDHLAHLANAMKKVQVNVKGYFAWSWCDNFEWSEGYTERFGMIYIDFNHNQARHPKHSALWFAKFLKSKKKSTLISNEQQSEDNSKTEAETEAETKAETEVEIQAEERPTAVEE
ncbi:UNVERIFIED_CONTAM: Raucaffricine-O-beta-D-glucosidase [Sesamum latifolium]|uniref:Raucaffricine-O-beta-D-glucosidase n=1 Tax=Sesamum latifolium TaxID=2727402 RepID=A0AAW2UIB4_9LAMI